MPLISSIVPKPDQTALRCRVTEFRGLCGFPHRRPYLPGEGADARSRPAQRIHPTMRRALLAAALAASTLSSGPATAQDEKRTETIDGLLRIVGAQAGIVLYCRKLYTVDDLVSEGLSRTVRRALDAAVGPRQAQTAIAEEGRRVARTIAEVGADQWCADQREILNTDGVRVFVD